MAIILAIESSCDETSIALLKDKQTLLAQVTSTQIATHARYGGVVPEIASRLHIELISQVLKEVVTQADINLEQIDAVAVTIGPGLIGSLHIGIQAAKTIALFLERPFIGVHHLAGHIYAASLVQTYQYPLLALVVSGGHTQLVYMEAAFDFKVVGETHDDAVGEAYDKVARLLNLPYPGGPQIDKLAKEGNVTYNFPIPMQDQSLNFSFSGLKSSVINLIHNKKQKGVSYHAADIAASFQKAAVESLVQKTMTALKRYPSKQLIIAGGVAANSALRDALTTCMAQHKDVELVLPPLWCCGDNAAMIAAAAQIMFEKQLFSPLDQGASPNFEL